MIHKEEWRFRQSWLDYVKSTWRGVGRVDLVNDQSVERLSFLNTARCSFEDIGFDFRQIKTYISIQKPEEGEGYAEQYPHVHYPLDGLTLVHYLDPGDKPAPLDIFNGYQVIETIIPKPGLTVFVPNSTLHGVHKNTGKRDRIQLIATALR